MWLSGSRLRNRSGKNGPRVAAVLLHLVLDRHDVGEDVPVRDDDALGLGGRSRREDDLDDRVARRARTARSAAVVASPEPAAAAGAAIAFRPASRQTGTRVRDRPGRQFDLVADQHDAGPRRSRATLPGSRARPGSRSARRRRRGATVPQKATIHSGRFSPQTTTLSSCADAVRRQRSGKRLSGGRYLGIGPRIGHGTRRRVRETCRGAAEVGEEVEKGLARHRTLGGDGRVDETGLTRG